MKNENITCVRLRISSNLMLQAVCDTSIMHNTQGIFIFLCPFQSCLFFRRWKWDDNTRSASSQNKSQNSMKIDEQY